MAEERNSFSSMTEKRRSYSTMKNEKMTTPPRLEMP
jgi:ribosomal protein L33